MKKISILLVNSAGTPFSTLEKLNRSTYRQLGGNVKSLPAGLLYISAYLKKMFPDRLTQKLLDFGAASDRVADYDCMESFIAESGFACVDEPPDIVAISVMFSTAHTFARKIVEVFRRLWPDSVFIMGGVHATAVTEYILKTIDVDYVFRGESELAMVEFVKGFEHRENHFIKGVYSKKNIGGSFDQLCEPVMNLDELPMPNLDLLNMVEYLKTDTLMKLYDAKSSSRVYEFITSRGCPFNCTFCACGTVTRKNVRYRSVENVMKEILIVHERYGANAFLANDDLMTANRMRMLGIFNHTDWRYIDNAKFYTVGIHCDTTDNEIIDAVARHSKVIRFPVESGCPETLRAVKKNVNLVALQEKVEYARSKNLIVLCNFIFGFPGETIQQMEETVSYMRNLKADWYTVFTAIPFPGTEMNRQFVERGHIKQYDEELWETSHYGNRMFDTDECSAEFLTNFVYEVNLDLNFINNYNLRSGNFKKAILLFEDIVRMYPFHVFAKIGLYYAYSGLGDTERAEILDDEIRSMVIADSRSLKMATSHRRLLSETKFYDLQA